MPSFLEKILSIKNKNNHKVISLCGLRLKFKNKQSYIKDTLNQTFCELKNIRNEINTFKLALGIKNKKAIKKDNVIDISNQTELIENKTCPYCSSKKIYSIRDFSINEMADEYSNMFNINPYGDIFKDVTLEKMHCFDCELEFYNYQIPDSALLYEKMLESGRYHYNKHRWEYMQAINIIKKYNLEKVLDIGCGEGHFLVKINPIVKFAMGSEFNKIAIKRCLEKNLNVTDKTLDKIDEKFDFICIFHVLEHINKPKDFIEQALNLLLPDGLLLIATPNPEGAWCQSSSPSIMNLPPHHCLDVTKEFYYNLEKDFPIKMLDYIQDKMYYWQYANYVLPKNSIIFERNYADYLSIKDKLLGNNHIAIYQKTKEN